MFYVIIKTLVLLASDRKIIYYSGKVSRGIRIVYTLMKDSGK
jgi:hypothetical protein